MCGISGIVKADIVGNPSWETAAKLQQHRGPDYFGHSTDRDYVFYHNRLSIIDLSDSSNQPYEDANFAMVFNGEIYNYKELFSEHFPEKPIPPGDTIALFELIKLKGEQAFDLLNGMFTIVFFDKQQRCLWLARDRMGIKPLYYFIHDGHLFFASEQKTIYTFYTLYHPLHLNRVFVDDVVANGHPEFGVMPFHGVHELSPGALLQFHVTQPHNPIHSTYYQLSQAVASALPHSHYHNTTNEKKLLDTLDELLHRSVQLHLISDAPLGTLCSGGVDSSLITALATQYNPNLTIYHAGVRGGGGEEAYADIVAKHLRIDIQYKYMDTNEYLTMLPRIAYHADLPIYHPSDVSLFAIAQQARTDKVKVLLCGEGADELFGGYQQYLYYHQHQQLHPLLANLWKRWLNLRHALLYRTGLFNYDASPAYFWQLSANALNHPDDNIPLFAKRNNLIRNTAALRFTDSLLQAYQQAYGQHTHTQLAAFISHDLGGYLSSLLHRNDRMCMMASVEARVPFIENQIIQFALHLHPTWKVHHNERKYLLKKLATRYLPKNIVYRKKAGFPVAWRTYIQHANPRIFLHGFITDTLQLPADTLQRYAQHDTHLQYSLLALELWGRLHYYRQPIEEVQNLLI